MTGSYTLICTSTDYDAWRVGEAPVTVEEVVKTLHTNAAYSRAVAAGILQAVHDHVEAGKLTGTKGSMQWSCVTKREVRPMFPWPRLHHAWRRTRRMYKAISQAL